MSVTQGVGVLPFDVDGQVGQVVVTSSDEDAPDGDDWSLVLKALPGQHYYSGKICPQRIDGTRGRVLEIMIDIPDGVTPEDAVNAATETLEAVHGQVKPVTPGG